MREIATALLAAPARVRRTLERTKPAGVDMVHPDQRSPRMADPSTVLQGAVRKRLDG